MSMISFDLLIHFHDNPSTHEGKEGRNEGRPGEKCSSGHNQKP